MSEASFASLGPTLLARKGGAKPAMRPQLAPLPETVNAEQLEDLGWNDMGQDDSESADIVSITPVAKASPAANEDEESDPLTGDSPLVVRQQKRLAQRILADAAMDAEDDEAAEADIELVQKKPAKKKKGTAKKKASAKSARRAAFTLRLDTDRHLKLRLAATMQGVSAQALVTEALDAMLSEIDDLDALASRMKRN